MTSEQTKKDYEEERALTEKNDVNKKELENKSFFEKLKEIKSNITVEPIFAGLIIGSTLARLAVQNLNLDKACRLRARFGDDICDALIDKTGNYSNEEAEVQKIISGIESWRNIILTSIPTLLVIFMGAWSDRTGNRKVCILLPIFGEFMVCLCNVLSTYFFYEIPVEVTMFLEVIFPAVTGGWVLVYLGVFSYISDITDEESRTFRVGIVNLCLTAGIPIGTAVSGILLKFWGYYGIFTLSGSIYLVTFSYGYFYLESNTKPDARSSDKPKPVSCFDIISLVKETAAVAFKKRQGNFRSKIILTLLVVAIIYGPDHGERIITYMYLRYKLQWDAVQYSLYSTYGIIAHSIGALISLSIFSKRWGFHDSVLCLISIISKLAGSIAIIFVQTTFQMYMVPIVEILNATTYTSLRSLASKLIASEEMGKMNSLISLVETLAALVFDPTYSTIYAGTVAIFTGAVYVYSALMTIPAIGILLWIYIRHKLDSRNPESQLE